MMSTNPRQVLILAAGVCVLCIILFLWLFVFGRSTPPPPPIVQQTPTATRIPAVIPSEYIAKNDVPAYLGSVPKDGAENVNLFESFFVDFDREIENESFKIFLSPVTPFQVKKNGSQLELKPLLYWRPDTHYRIGIIENYSGREVVAVRFVTMNDKYSSGDTAPLPKHIIEDEENTKKISPETFLMNRLPFENDLVMISGEYDKEYGNFVFLVQSKNKDINAAKIEMKKLFSDLEMNAELVKKLKIIYQ